MVNRIFSVAGLALACLVATSAQAQETPTQVYTGTVVRVSGPHASAIRVGDPITVSYTVDTSAKDSNPLANEGVFHGGLTKLSITVAGSNLKVTTGAGTVQTFDNELQGPSDQAFFYSFSPLPATLNGSVITSAEVDFIDRTLDASGMPTMLGSDAIPTHYLVTEDSFALVGTAEGATFINFVSTPASNPSVSELVEDGTIRLAELKKTGAVHGGTATALTAKLDQIVAAANVGDVAGACDALQSFRNQVERLRNRQISAAAADELMALAEVIRQTLGGC